MLEELFGSLLAALGGVLLIGVLGVAAYSANLLYREPKLFHSRFEAQGIYGPPPNGVGIVSEIQHANADPTERLRDQRRLNLITVDAPIHSVLRKYAAQYGNVFTVQMGRLPQLIVGDATMAKQILQEKVNDFNKGPRIRGTTGRFLGITGILLSEGEEWRKNRKIVSPAFHFEFLSHLVPMMIDIADDFVALWKNKETVTSIAADLSSVTLNVVGSAQFGRSSIDDSSAEMYAALTQGIHGVRDLVVNAPRLMLLPFVEKWPIARIQKLMANKNTTQKMGLNLVRNRLEGRSLQQQSSGKDILQLMIEARYEDGSKMTEKSMIAEACTFIIAGHETTSTMLTWCMYLLGKYPDVQQKCYEEVLDVLGPSATPTLEHVKRLTYINAVLMETLRLFPSIPSLSREAVRDTTLSDGTNTYHIPKGTGVEISQWLLQRDERYWPHPDQFDPSRFLDQSKHPKRPACSFNAFGAGRRNCIGKNFAMQEAKIVMTRLLQSFSWANVDGARIEPTAFIMMHPKHEIPLRLFRRDRDHNGGRTDRDFEDSVSRMKPGDEVVVPV